LPEQFATLGLIWIFVYLYLFLKYRGQYLFGLLSIFLILYFGDYGLQGFIHALPHFTEYFADTNYREAIFNGFVQSTIGLLGLTFGFVVIAPVLQKINRGIIHKTKFSLTPIDASIETQIDPMRLALVYVVTGLVSYFILRPTLGTIPTINTFMQGLYSLFPAGLILGLLFTESSAEKPKYIRPLFIALLFLWPLVGVIRDGFLGFGFFIVIAVLGFSLVRIKHLVRLGILGVVLGYIALSVMVTYFINRGEIRGAVWGGAEFDTRLEVVGSSFLDDFQWFDVQNITHLLVIDGRMGLNYLTGLSVHQLENNYVEYAYGQTITDAFLAVVPRAIWPDKPVVTGGSDNVAQYTGLTFARGTTVSMGYVMEMFINFGTSGVIGGFLILGILLRLLGSGVEVALQQKQNMKFAAYLVAGLGVALIGNEIAVLFAAAASGFLTVVIYNRLLLSYAPPSLLFGYLDQKQFIKKHELIPAKISVLPK